MQSALKNKNTIKSLVAYSLYVLVFTVILPFLPLRLLWRGKKAPAYRARIAERFGINSLQVAPQGIWIHAVSVGEVIAAIPVIQQLKQRYPEKNITVTTTTPTGSQRLLAALGDQVHHVYAPYDWPLFVWVFLRKLQPSMAIIIETELWPVTLLMCRKRGIPLLVANARLSAKSAAGYRRISWLSRAMLQNVWIAAQSSDDSRRFIEVGADEKRLTITGSVKFDIAITTAQHELAETLRNMFERAGKGFVWVAASTHPGEDEIVLKAHQQLLQYQPSALLLLVPRHPERFNEVASLLEKAALNYVRRSSQHTVNHGTSVYLMDTMGELMACYGASDSAFVGGSLVPVGGHNYLEPAVWAVPVISGPYRHNFEHIATLLEKAAALQTASSAVELAALLVHAVDNSEERSFAGKAAQTTVNNNRGAGERLQVYIEQILSAKN
jgi:3-deoxy-D-manno-octulosonic-acid transferase